MANRSSMIAPMGLAGPEKDKAGTLARVKYFINRIDGRYDELRWENAALNACRHFDAGLAVDMVAIPLAMRFAMASAARPGQGIVRGAIAGMIGLCGPAPSIRCAVQPPRSLPCSVPAC